MRILRTDSWDMTLGKTSAGPVRSGMRTKLLLALMPSVVFVLMATGYLTYVASRSFLDTAVERLSRVQAHAMAHAVETYLAERRQDLLFIAQGEISQETVLDYLAKSRRVGRAPLLEAAYFAQGGGRSFLFVMDEDEIVPMPVPHAFEIQLLAHALGDEPLAQGEVRIGSIEPVGYTLRDRQDEPRMLQARVVRMLTRVEGGYLMLSFDVREVRNILSLYVSPRSPLWAYPRTLEVRLAFLFDTKGWILFQSEDVEQGGAELGTYLARTGLNGTLGLPELPAAFRPGAIYGDYWHMVEDVRQGKADLIHSREMVDFTTYTTDYFLAYVPVRFAPGNGKTAEIYAGIGYVDRSRMPLMAGYKQMDVMLVITLLTILLIAGIIFYISRRMTKPLMALSREVNAMQSSGRLRPIDLDTTDHETQALTEALNNLIITVQHQMGEIRHMDQAIQNASLKERADLDTIIQQASNGQEASIPEIIGFGPQMERLKADIFKASQVDVDVLVCGETGTGKQLTAEAVHRLSRRGQGPFVSINCGALDENLLLDTLFGHVKGAFTEAKTDRNGAFLEAQGGTLFLDEIQTASAKVQQALLRAIAMRRIRPLGSDKEADVDVRLIAASNLDLLKEIEQGRFRQDLYYRLKVLSIDTVPLREQKHNIPVLAARFLKQTEPVAGKESLGLSKGALDAMMAYDWPGNIRELQNCMTMAAVMTEGEVIQVEDLRLNDASRGTPQGQAALRLSPAWPSESAREAGPDGLPDGPLGGSPNGSPSGPPDRPSGRQQDADPPGNDNKAPGGDAAQLPADLPPGLNSRQAKAYPVILQEGGVTRGRYQEIMGGNLSARTANYDLGELVKLGLLVKVGRGPATRYETRRNKFGN